MKITITGATGLIGGHLLNELTQHHAQVQALRRKGSTPRIPLRKEPTWIEGQLTDLPEKKLVGTDCLIHLAAHGVDPSTANWNDCFRINVMESLELWLRAARSGIKNFIILGSCFEYGSTGDACKHISVDTPLMPTGPYHASKAAATMVASAFARTEQVKVWVLRPFHIYGEGEAPNRLYPQVLEAAQHGRDLDLTEGMQIRDFMYVKEAVQLIHGYALMVASKKNKSFFKISNLGTGNPATLRDFASKIWLEQGAKGKLNFGAIPYRKAEVMRYVPKIDQAEINAAQNALSGLT